MKSIAVTLLLCTNAAFAGFEFSGAGGRIGGMGGAFTGLADDAWAIWFNAGGLARISNAAVSAYHAPGLYGLNELSSTMIVAALPTSFGSLGLSWRTFGTGSLYKESTIKLAYACAFEDVDIGIALAYQGVSIERYGSASTMGVDVGILVHLGATFGVGVAAQNVNAPSLGASQENLPQMFTAGISYTPVNRLVLALDYQKGVRQDASPRAGFEYWIVESLAVRGGFQNAPSQYSSGIGARYSLVQFDYGFSIHQELGWTHHTSVTITW
jgi:hypothetical protein